MPPSAPSSAPQKPMAPQCSTASDSCSPPNHPRNTPPGWGEQLPGPGQEIVIAHLPPSWKVHIYQCHSCRWHFGCRAIKTQPIEFDYFPSKYRCVKFIVVKNDEKS